MPRRTGSVPKFCATLRLRGCASACLRDLPADTREGLDGAPARRRRTVLPCIGPARPAVTDVVHAFGHGHVGLTAGAATGKVAGGSDQRQAAGNRYCALRGAAFLISPPTRSVFVAQPAAIEIKQSVPVWPSSSSTCGSQPSVVRVRRRLTQCVCGGRLWSIYWAACSGGPPHEVVIARWVDEFRFLR